MSTTSHAAAYSFVEQLAQDLQEGGAAAVIEEHADEVRAVHASLGE